MMATFALLLKWQLWSLFITQALSACYFPDGRLADNDTPCRDDTENSVCCGQGYACLSNGICQATGEELQKPGATEFVRGGCTDKEWRSSSCPLFCIDPKVDNTGGGMGLAKCEDTKQDLYWCINSEQEDVSCKEGTGLIFFPGTPSAITTIGVSPETSTTSTPPTDTAKSVSSTQSSSESSDSIASSTVPQATISETNTSPDEDDENKKVSAGTIAGAVVGCLAGIAVIGGFSWWFLRRRRATTRAAPAPPEPTAYPNNSKHATWFSGGGSQEVYGGFEGWGNHQYTHELEERRSAPQELATTYNEPYPR